MVGTANVQLTIPSGLPITQAARNKQHTTSRRSHRRIRTARCPALSRGDAGIPGAPCSPPHGSRGTGWRYVSYAPRQLPVILRAASALDPHAIAAVATPVRLRLLNASSYGAACCRAMMRGRWRDKNTAVASPFTAWCASRPMTAPAVSGCCVTWNGCATRSRTLALRESQTARGGTGPLRPTPLQLLDASPPWSIAIAISLCWRRTRRCPPW